MPNRAFSGSTLPIRTDLVDAHEQGWAAIAAPGTWFTGAQRNAVAAEIRHSRDCDHCAKIKAALSPNGVAGAHDTKGRVTAGQAELIHRLVNDPGRLSEKWSAGVLALGVTEGEYIEITGLVAMVMIMDTCHLALGLPLRDLPQAQAGDPTRYRPPGAKRKAAWLPIVEPEDAVESDGALYPNPKAGYIYRALSSVPKALHDYWAVANCHYIPGPFVYQFGTSIRAITRPQTEVLAGRVSALHQCAY